MSCLFVWLVKSVRHCLVSQVRSGTLCLRAVMQSVVAAPSVFCRSRNPPNLSVAAYFYKRLSTRLNLLQCFGVACGLYWFSLGLEEDASVCEHRRRNKPVSSTACVPQLLMQCTRQNEGGESPISRTRRALRVAVSGAIHVCRCTFRAL